MVGETGTIDIQSLTDEERMEYAEICEYHRHEDTIAYQLASVLLPLSFGAIAVSVEFPDMRCALALFSIALYLYWVLFSVRLAWFSEIRLKRARELEAKAGLHHHRAFDDPPLELKGKWGYRISIRKLRWLFLFLLFFGWMVVLVSMYMGLVPA